MTTAEEAREFLAGLEERIKPLEKDYLEALWQVASAGASKAKRLKSYANYARFVAESALANATEGKRLPIYPGYDAVLSEPAVFARLDSLHGEEFDDPLLARQIDILYRHALGMRSQLSPLKRAQKELSAMLHIKTFRDFKKRIDGTAVTDNHIGDILKDSEDAELRRKAWEADMSIGEKAAPHLIRLVKLKNEAARANCFGNAYEQALYLQRMTVEQLFGILDGLETQLRPLYDEAKAEMDVRLAERFGIPVGELMPWHYSPRFHSYFGEGFDLDQFYADKDVAELTKRFFRGLGMDIDSIIAESDIYEGEGKYQGAFMMHLDRDGDIRFFANCRNDAGSMKTLLHEGGHAVHYKYISPELPFFLRTNEMRVTEALAMMMDKQANEPEFFEEMLGLDKETTEGLLSSMEEDRRIDRLTFCQRYQVFARFERAMYEDPDQDLNALWSELTEKYRGIKMPEGRSAPDFGRIAHYNITAYIHEYLLGELVRAQVMNRIRSWTGRSLVNNPEAGRYLINRVFSLGQSLDWNDLMVHATGEPLNPRYFVEECKR